MAEVEPTLRAWLSFQRYQIVIKLCCIASLVLYVSNQLFEHTGATDRMGQGVAMELPWTSQGA